MFRLISSEVQSDNWGILTKYEFELRLRNGECQHQTRETYDRGNGATCLLFNPETTCVLLTRQFRLPVFLNGGIEALIEAPAGLLEGSDADSRMRAELLEETGFQTPTLTHLFDISMSPGSVTEYISFFKGLYSSSVQVAVGSGKLEEGEDIKVLEVPLADAMEIIESGDIRDAKTIILLQHLMIENLQKSLEYP